MCILPVYLEGTDFWCFLFSFNILFLLIKKKDSEESVDHILIH